MAGRGTDILLGGNPDYMARLKLGELLFPEVASQARWAPGVEGSGPFCFRDFGGRAATPTTFVFEYSILRGVVPFSVTTEIVMARLELGELLSPEVVSQARMAPDLGRL